MCLKVRGLTRVNQNEFLHRLGYCVRILTTIIQRNWCLPVTHNINFEVIHQIFCHGIWSSNDYFVDVLKIKLNQKKHTSYIQFFPLLLINLLIATYLACQHTKHTFMNIHDWIIGSFIVVHNGIGMQAND